MPNFASIINSHNKNILNENIANPTSASCNCRVKVSFRWQLLTISLAFICKAATSKITNDYSHYIGLTKNCLKDRLYKHKNLFRYDSKKNATELSSFVGDSKHADTETSPECKILDKAKSYEALSRRLMLCLTEIPHPPLISQSVKFRQRVSDKM